MSSETITEPLPNKSKRTWWVRFQKLNGKLVSITPKKYSSDLLGKDELLAEVDNPVCKEILRGHKSKKEYAILWDYKNDCWNLDKKSTTLNLKPTDNKLFPIQEYLDKDLCDLHVTLYTQDRTVLIYANLRRIAESMNLADISYISTTESKLLDLYITKKNDPDYLVHVLHVDAKKLINNERYMLNLSSDINKIIDWDNISIYTKPVFRNYGFDIRKGSGKNVKNKSNNHILMSSNFDKENADINIYIHNDKLCFGSAFNENHINYFNGKTKFNMLVCDQTVDHFVGNIELDVTLLCREKVYMMDLPDFWPADPLIVHKSNQVRISYTGEKDAQNAKH